MAGSGECEAEGVELGRELEALDRQLQLKVAWMNRMAVGDGQMSSMKAHYNRVIEQIEEDKASLMAERDRAGAAVLSLTKASDEQRRKEESTYKGQLKLLEKLAAVQKKLQHLKPRSDEAGKREDIAQMKTVRVELCRRMERESKGHQERKRATPSARCRRSARKRQRGSRRTPRRR